MSVDEFRLHHAARCPFLHILVTKLSLVQTAAAEFGAIVMNDSGISAAGLLYKIRQHLDFVRNERGIFFR